MEGVARHLTPPTTVSVTHIVNGMLTAALITPAFVLVIPISLQVCVRLTIFTCVALAKCRSSSGPTPSVCSSVHPYPTILGCLVYVISNSKSFYSFIFKFRIMIVHTLKMFTYYFVHFIMNIFLIFGRR